MKFGGNCPYRKSEMFIILIFVLLIFFTSACTYCFLPREIDGHYLFRLFRGHVWEKTFVEYNDDGSSIYYDYYEKYLWRIRMERPATRKEAMAFFADEKEKYKKCLMGKTIDAEGWLFQDKITVYRIEYEERDDDKGYLIISIVEKELIPAKMLGHYLALKEIKF